MGNISQDDQNRDWFARTNGDYVAWASYRNDAGVIMLYEINTGAIRQLSPDDEYQYFGPVLDGNWIIWDGGPGFPNWEIFLYRICPPGDDPAPIAQPTLTDPALSKIGALAPGQLGLPGETITWTITATAPNADLTNVVISDTFAAALQIDGVTTTSGTATVNGQTLTVTIPFMAAGSSVTIQVTTTILSSPVGGVFTNTATLSADGGVTLSATGTVTGVSGLPSTGYAPH